MTMAQFTILLAWVGTGLQILGAIGLASRLVRPALCYITMLPGAAILLEVAAGRRDLPQVVLMAVFFLINLVGTQQWRRT